MTYADDYLIPLIDEGLRTLIGRGGWVIDVRPVADFAAGHLLREGL